MIENVYSNSKDDKGKGTDNNTYKLPKNIRQIGKVEGNKRIYVEDYVMTYVKKLDLKEYGYYKYAILLGNYIKIDGTRNIFISGAIEVKEIDDSNGIKFSNETWTGIYEDIKEYFAELEIVGWYIGGAGLSLKTDDRILKTHLDNFAGQDKTLLMYDSVELEDAFFVYESNHLKKQQGYYIYYEKNKEMQNYMIQSNNGASIEEVCEDRVVKDMRKILEHKKEQPSGKNVVGLLYGASIVLTMVVLVIAATMLNNYGQMKNMEEALKTISNNLKGEDDNTNNLVTTNADKDKPVTEVETLLGNITSIKEEYVDEESSDNEDGEEKKDTKEDVTEKKDITDSDTDENETKSEDISKRETTEETKPTDKKTQVKSEEEKEIKEEKADEKKADQESKDVSSLPEFYIIKKGDTLASISIKFYHSISYLNAIQEANNIDDQDKILIGQKIILP